MYEIPLPGRNRPAGSRNARIVTVRAALAAAAVLVSTGCAPAGVATPPSDAPPAAASSSARSSLSPPPVGRAGLPTLQKTAPPSGRSGSADIPVASANGSPAAPSPAPVQLEYPRLGASLPVVPTGVRADGQMEIPDDAAVAGWYRYSPAPADSEGHTVITAHAGSEQTPEGPLYSLRRARAGDEVTVRDDDGRSHRYQVTAVEQLGKDGLDFTPYFARSGPERLVLVTCGGQWLSQRGTYADNIIVVAEPQP